MAKKHLSLEEQIKLIAVEMERSFATWDKLRESGGQDPFWSDGTNMNLVRNHIIYYKNELLMLCGGTINGLLPEVYYKATPPEVSDHYMAPKGKHLKRRLSNLRKNEGNEGDKVVYKAPARKFEWELF